MMVYRYGALKPTVIGGTFEDLLEYQRLSNRFYNDLVEVERWRIAAQDITEILQGERLTAEQKTEIRLAYNAACRSAGQLTSIGWGQKQAVTERVAAAMTTRRADEARAARKATAKEWHYLKRVLAVPRPRYRRYDGEGILAATVQGASDLSVDSVLSGAPNFSIQGEGKRRVARLRLRDGLVLEVPFVYHRPLPKCRVIFARLAVERIGTRWIYSLHVTLDASPQKVTPGVGKCAINFGWRRLEHGVRVAYAVGDDGREQECIIPHKIFERMKHAESLRSLADELADLYLGNGERRSKHRALALSQPHATHRELGLVPFSHERAALHSSKDAEHWARRDRHLYQWERDEYSSALRARREIFRLWARKIASEYAECVIEAFDMRRVIEHGVHEMQIPGARHYRFMVGPHYLRLEIKSRFGERCEVLKPAKLSLSCHVCGKRCKWDRARELRHDCESCGATWDQDSNNAKNQLAAAAE